MRNTLLALTTLCISLISSSAFAAAEHQAFGGVGVGFEVLSKDGSGTGFYFQGQGGVNITSVFGAGLHAGYSSVGGVGIQTADFGSFLQAFDGNSGIYGRLYFDGVYAAVTGGGLQHGVKDGQVGFAPGAGLGLLIPAAGDFHMVPELNYRAAFLDSTVNLINATFNLIWDF